MEPAITLFNAQPVWAQSALGLAGLALLALAVNFLLKKVILQLAAPFLDTRTLTADKAAARLATVAPLLIVANGIELVPYLYPTVRTLVHNIAMACVVLSVAMAISKALDYINEIYNLSLIHI